MSKRASEYRDLNKRSKLHISKVIPLKANDNYDDDEDEVCEENNSSTRNINGGIIVKHHDSIPIQLQSIFHEYANMVFNSVFLNMKAVEEDRSVQLNRIDILKGVIRPVIYHILEYNKIIFQNITVEVMTTNVVDLHEPLWYHMDIEKSWLILLIQSNMFERFYKYPVIDAPYYMTSGILDLSDFNPIESSHDVIKFNPFIYSLAVAIDHVAQHIINHFYTIMDCGTDSSLLKSRMNSPLHENWIKYGVTFSSMIAITCNLGTRNPIAYAKPYSSNIPYSQDSIYTQF